MAREWPATAASGTVNVSDGLKRAVEAAIVKFDFQPNAAARGLALGRTSTIGVVAQAIDSPFYGEGLRGIEAGLRQRGYAPFIMSGNWRVEAAGAASLAIRHLAGLGHRQIAFITGSENHPDAIERLRGYKEALAEADIEFNPKLVAVGDWHEEGGVRSTLELLGTKLPFTARLCVNDQTAYGACHPRPGGRTPATHGGSRR